MPDLDLDFVDRMVAEIGDGPETVIPILQSIQQHFRYLPEPALKRVCDLTAITPAQISGVSTFYTGFRHEPVGKHLIQVCQGTACHVKRAMLVEEAIAHHLHIAPGEHTDSDGQFTIQQVACLGCCTLAPVVQIEEKTYGRLTPQAIPQMLRDFLRDHSSKTKKTAGVSAPVSSSVGEVRIGLGSCCVAQGSGEVYDTISDVLSANNVPATLKRVGCVGMCHQTPLVELVEPDGKSKLFSRVQPDGARDIVLRHFKPRGVARRLGFGLSRLLDRLHTNEVADPVRSHSIDVRDKPVCAFLGPQRRVATEHCGSLDPLDLDEYLRHDGFVALRRCLNELAPGKILDEIRQSGLRGRGGAGFPTHIKWDKVQAAVSGNKYIICNGDEGDPGAFMDRMILESVPYRVIEGMAIAALTVGAHEGLFYIRAEYPLAVQRVQEALRQCEARGFLGDSVMGSDFSLRLSIKEGAGAFICGEETALIQSIEGRRGTPVLRPPYPAEDGLHGCPTLINNVETTALVPWIVRNGASQFSAMGTETSKGTKVFALAGKIRRGGLIEVPMGVTLREVVDDIGGGVAAGRQLKAVQVGGPSGGCVPAELADTPIDYEELAKVGAIMGSGGLVVLDDTDCMVDIARYFLRFTQDQSCGKCTFCRIGTKRMLEILDRICTGHGRKGDLEQLEQLSRDVCAGSLCGLGKTAPNPVLSTLKYFREEYQAHIEGRCPTGKCKELIRYEITDGCIGCTLCAQHCPADAIPLTPYQRHTIDMQKCTRCDTCVAVCPEGTVVVTSGD